MKKRKPPAAAPLKQTTLKSRISMKMISKSDALFLQEAVAPELTPDNAVGRFVLAPPSLWPDHGSEDTGGFVGKVHKCLRTAGQPTTIKFEDGSFSFSFAYVKSQFKTLS